MAMPVKKTSTGPDMRFEVPLYTFTEAARALDVHRSTFATWAKGYVRRPHGRKAVTGAPIVTSFAVGPRELAVPFVGLAEGMVLAAVRRSGVPLQRVRPALEVLASEIGIDTARISGALHRRCRAPLRLRPARFERGGGSGE